MTRRKTVFFFFLLFVCCLLMGVIAVSLWVAFIETIALSFQYKLFASQLVAFVVGIALVFMTTSKKNSCKLIGMVVCISALLIEIWTLPIGSFFIAGTGFGASAYFIIALGERFQAQVASVQQEASHGHRS